MKFDIQVSREPIRINNCENFFTQNSLAWLKGLSRLNQLEYFQINLSVDGTLVSTLPLLKATANGISILQSCPYPSSYGGVLYNAKAEKIPGIFRNVSNELYTNQEIMSGVHFLTFVLPPFSKSLEEHKRYFAFDHVIERKVTYLNLKSDFSMRQSSKFRYIRRLLKKASDNELYFSMSDRLEDFEDWFQIIEAKLETLGVLELDKDFYYSTYSSCVKSGSALLAFAEQKGKRIAAGLYFFNSDIVDVFLRASLPGLEHTQCGIFLDYKIIEYFKRRGLSVLNWQGSPKNQIGVHKYKKSWGSEDDSIYYLNQCLVANSPLFSHSPEKLRVLFPGFFIYPYGD